MRPRFLGRLGPADVISVANGVLGFLAVVAATVDPGVAARLILLAGVGDGLDGVVARRFGGTPVGRYLDSLSDVAAFGVAPGLVVARVAHDAWGVSWSSPSPALLAAIGVPAAYVAMVVIRLAFYTAFDAEGDDTQGVQSTLAATVLAAAVLTRIVGAAPLVAATGVFAYLMVTRVEYPDLLARDAVIMGTVQGIAVLAPEAVGRAFPYALLTLAVAYLALAPRFYWGPEELRHRTG